LKKRKDVKSLNEKLITDLSIEEIENRLSMEDLPRRLQGWGCSCNNKGCDDCFVDTW